MKQVYLERCFCCGQPIASLLVEDCPRCHYPVTLEKEELFLEKGVQDLRYYARYGGIGLTVGELIRRYVDRLNVLRKLKAMPIAPEQAGLISAPARQIMPMERPAEKISANLPLASNGQSTARAARPLFSFRSFLADQTINIVASLGAFLVLIGALSFIATTTDLLLSCMIVFGIHALFGGVGFGTYRFRTFRVVAIIYTIIFALLVPLVGFSAYRLIEGHLIAIAVPTLVAVAAAYAAIVYCLLAVYQRFKPFGYLGIVALAVADLALAQTLGLAYWWWPDMLMLLAFPMLLSVADIRRKNAMLDLPTQTQPCHSERSEESHQWRVGSFIGREILRFAQNDMAGFTQNDMIGQNDMAGFAQNDMAGSVLREPVRLLMFVFVGGSAVGMLIALAAPFVFGGMPIREARLALLTMSLLLLAWTVLLLWVTKRSREAIVVALLLLVCVLSFCFAFDFTAIGYALALTLVALLYHGLYRFAARLLEPFGRAGFHLDTIALWLVAVVPLIASPLLLEQLYARAFTAAGAGTAPYFIGPQLVFQMSWEGIAELIAVILGVVVAFDVTFSRAKAPVSTEIGKNNWCWLLLLPGFLLNVAFGLAVLMLNVVPVWSFLGLTLALVGIAVVVRRRYGAAWANALDVIALVEACFTFTLSIWQSVDSIWGLLLFFAVLSYSLVLYQRRYRLLFLPLLFALAALPLLFSNHVVIMLLVGLLLPLVAVAIRRLFAEKAEPVYVAAMNVLRLPIMWEWPLLSVGLLCGVLVTIQDVWLSSSVFQGWSGVNMPAGVEIAGLALAWYASAALARARLWLIPAIAFAVCALMLTANPFWALVGITPAAALLAVGVSRMAGRTWAMPLYSVALLGAIMAGYAGYAQGHWQAASWVLVAFAALAYAIGVVENQPIALWIAAALATWSVIDAAVLVGDLYRPPVTALLCAGIGVAIGRFKTVSFPFIPAERRQKLLGYALPFYTTALAAAVLTGVYGTLSGINMPFYGAVPDALLFFALVAFGASLLERAPYALIIPIGLATWAIGLLPVDLIQRLLAYDLLCVIVFVSQFAWRGRLPSMHGPLPMRLHRVFGLGGLTLIVLCVIGLGGLSVGAGQLAHVGGASLLILSLLLFWYGRLQPSIVTRRYCAYGVVPLLSLVISWELVAFGQTRLELLTLAPATYLIVLAPFLMRDEALPQHHSAAQIASIAGAALLLLPELWLSFGQDNLLPTLLLAGESLVLLVLGITTRVRIFVLSGAALVVVSGLRALFLPTLGLSPSLALTVLGVTLLAIATGLSLARHRLQVAWTRWE